MKERKKERILIERMKERKQEKEKERKKERREKERKIPANCRVDQLLVLYTWYFNLFQKAIIFQIVTSTSFC